MKAVSHAYGKTERQGLAELRVICSRAG